MAQLYTVQWYREAFSVCTCMLSTWVSFVSASQCLQAAMAVCVAAYWGLGSNSVPLERDGYTGCSSRGYDTASQQLACTQLSVCRLYLDMKPFQTFELQPFLGLPVAHLSWHKTSASRLIRISCRLCVVREL